MTRAATALVNSRVTEEWVPVERGGGGIRQAEGNARCGDLAQEERLPELRRRGACSSLGWGSTRTLRTTWWPGGHEG